MSHLKGKKILLGITGSIAAYKSASLTRLLIKAGCEVQILMTKAAADFITPLTLSTLSKKNVYSDVHSGESWNNHVEMGLWADVMIVAPATATTLSKMANGICDNIIVASYLSAKCPVFFAPAMDLDMWKHGATQQTIDKLKSYGNHLIPVGVGELASGLVGEGRMAEPEDIVQHLETFFGQKNDLQNIKALVTAGPTYEHLDPVRFIGNHSSGKMGVAIAKSLAKRGADVKLILGPSKLQVEHEGVEVIRVVSAQDMYKACSQRFRYTNVSVLAAAVADYRPITMAKSKIKKKEKSLNLDLKKTIDIAATLGKKKKANQLLIGFALETNNEEANAKSKIKRKNFDFIVLNSLNDKGAGFNVDTNKVSIIHKNNKIKKFELKTKVAVAEDIVDEIAILVKKNSKKKKSKK